MKFQNIFIQYLQFSGAQEFPGKLKFNTMWLRSIGCSYGYLLHWTFQRDVKTVRFINKSAEDEGIYKANTYEMKTRTRNAAMEEITSQWRLKLIEDGVYREISIPT